MKLISAEILAGNRLPMGVGVVHPSVSVYVILDGAVCVDGGELVSGQCYVVDESGIVTFEAEKTKETKLLRVALDALNGTELPLGTAFEVANSRLLDSFVGALGDKKLMIPMSEPSAESIAEYFVSALVEEQCDDTCGNKYVDMAKRYIDSNYFLDIKVEELAEKIGVDRKYLRNLFTEYLGVSTKDYIMNLRIERAKELLADGDIPVNSVAVSVGYSDALGFSKIFKKYTGLSPSDYRNGELNVDTPKKEPAQEAPARVKEDIKYFLL